MTALANKKVIVGISGGIAAYKSIDLVRQLKDAGAEVRVILTRGAAQFVTPLSLQSVADNPVHQELMDPAAEQVMSHIELARWADLIVIAPATAHLLAKLAHGMADDLLTTVVLATLTPILIAPAMNTQMWLNPATQANYLQLNGRR